MKPKDALGELVKEWREDVKLFHKDTVPTILRMADQLEKALQEEREGKVVVDREEMEKAKKEAYKFCGVMKDWEPRTNVREFFDKHLPQAQAPKQGEK